MNRFRRFMAGRYGSDALNVALLVIGILFYVIERLTRWRWIGVITLLMLVLCYFRIFSRNIQARYAENQKFLQWWMPKWQALQSAKARFADRKTHRYFKCPQCRQRLRVPRGRGKINISCPHCGNKFIRKS